MGYYADYSITVSGADNANQLIKIVKELDDGYLSDCGFSDDGTSAEFELNHTKWYGWKEECIRVSKIYPRITIDIDGKGEENGDLWKARVRKGECEVVEARIVFDDFKKLT